jgi:sporulation protein YqfC
MNRKEPIFQRIIRGSDLANPSITAKPLIEIIGCNRLLVENHICIISYSLQEISVRVKYGHITIHGDRLRLAYISTDKIVVTGCLYDIQLQQNKCQ